MPNFKIQGSSRHIWFSGVVAGVLSILLPQQALAVQVSQPVGVQEIGKTLNLKSSLSGIQEGAESQLRSSCLTASVRSIETSVSFERSGSAEVFVDFRPTSKRGGVLEFKSAAPVNDSLVELELVSQCPLAVFTSRWTLIMGVSAAPVGAVPALQRSSTVVREQANFDVRNSSLLSESRRAPQLPPQDAAKSAEAKTDTPSQVTAQASQAADMVASQAAAALIASINQGGADNPAAQQPVAPEEQAAVPGDLALLTPDVTVPGLIQSQPSTDMPGVGDSMGQLDPTMDGMAEPSVLDYFSHWQVMLPLVLLAILLLYYFVRKRLQGGRLKMATAQNVQPSIVPKVAASELHDKNIHREEAKPEVTGQATDRMLESLIVYDDISADDSYKSSPLLPQADVVDTFKKSALKTTLDMMNKADIPTWNLPEAFQGIVEQRNKSLALHRTTDALLLRCHVGLVELAYQDAKLGQETQSQVIIDLLGQVLGEYIYEVDSHPTLGVPDVVKSYVRAKMCEITGAQNRQLLHDNLLNLNTQVPSPALCFHTDAWREFMSDEGAMN